jgi:hypothetical protein
MPDAGERPCAFKKPWRRLHQHLTMWNTYLRDNINKLLDRGHRVLTVAQFSALTGLEGTKGSVAPDEVYLEVDATNGIQWHFGFESGEVTYKWRFLGGPPMFSEVATAEATASTGYVALGTAGPSIAIPRSGDYDVAVGCRGTNTNSATSDIMSYDIGGTGAVDADCGQCTIPGNTAFKPRRKTGLTPVTLTAKYRVSLANTGTFDGRIMSVRPVRVRHDA